MGIVTAWPGSDDNVVELHLVYARMLTTYPALAVDLALGILSISSVFRVTTFRGVIALVHCDGLWVTTSA